ncbi:MAG: GNAT family N-acetyltransferase [Rubrivivax sp.]
MPFSLLQLSHSELEDLADSRVPMRLGQRIELGALPPAFVAAGSLQLHASGHPEPWSTSFLIVRDQDDRIVGACGFKTPPENGCVEIGYGVSEAARDQGAATKAVALLVAKAFSAGATSVLAEILPDNHASAKVVQRNGFVDTGARNDKTGEYVVQWVRRSGA